MGFLRTTLRIGLVGAGLAAAGVLIAGPHRAAALFDRLRGAVDSAIDESIDDPSALRSQLRTLEAQYPQRITDLRGDLAQLVEQRRQMERDCAVAERVVTLADADLAALRPLLAQAEALRADAAPGQVVSVRFDDSAMPLEQANRRAAQIGQTRTAYASRARDAARDLTYLAQQQSRLEALLAQLETERADFQAQVWQLDRQVDSIARNDRLIALMTRRQQTMDECSRYEAGTLEQVHARMTEVRSRQEAQLELLAGQQERLDYEDLARTQLAGQELPFGAESAPDGTEGAADGGGSTTGDGASGTAAGDGVTGAATARGEVLLQSATPRPR